MTIETPETIEMGNGNIFADLGYADADSHLFKAQLVSRLKDAMARHGLTQTAAAKTVGAQVRDPLTVAKGRD